MLTGKLPHFPAISPKGTNFCNFLFASLDKNGIFSDQSFRNGGVFDDNLGKFLLPYST